MKTFTLKAAQIERVWHVLDADSVPLGRLASRAATLLRGKHKPTFTPHLDMGDFVVIVNAERVRLSSNEDNKKYYRHSGYPGSLRVRTFRELREKHPGRVIEMAVKGMLPHNRLGAKVIRHLKVYAGAQHPHEAQIRAGTGVRAQERQRTLAEKKAADAAAASAATAERAAARAHQPASVQTEDVVAVMTADAVTDLDRDEPEAAAPAKKPAAASRRKTTTAAKPAAKQAPKKPAARRPAAKAAPSRGRKEEKK